MRLNAIGLLALSTATFLVSCSMDRFTRKNNTLFQRLDNEQTGIMFTNEVVNDDQMNIFNYRNFYNGGGVAIGDVDNDGLADVYMTSNQGENKLFRNKGNWIFEDITRNSGTGGTHTWSTGVVMVDINADGLLDIYVCNAGYLRGENQENELFINNGDLTFSEQAAEYNLNEGGYTTHAAFFDYDGDLDLDVYILNNSFMPVNTLNYSNKRELKAEDWPVKDFLKGGGDKLLRNDGGKYTDVTEDAGLYSSLIGFGLGVTVGDVNDDKWPDLYISNDFFERDYLYINLQNGTFREDIKSYMAHLSLFSMGADMADINNDGLPEVFVTDMLPDNDERLKRTSSFETYSVYNLKQERDFYHQYMHNTLQLNTGNNTFREISFYAGVAASDWSWGALMFDMDNDSYRDIYVCNGIYKDVTDQDFIDFFANDVIQKMALTGKKEEMSLVLDSMPSTPLKNKAFRNEGESLRFSDAGENWGFDEPSFSNGAAYGDLDNDGDLDLVINNVNQEAFVYENHASDNGNSHFLAFQLRNAAPNTFAIGSEIQVFVGDKIISTEIIPSRGFQSSVDYKAVLGLGKHASVDSVIVIWPDRTSSTHFVTSVDTLLTLSHENRGVTKMVSYLPSDYSELLKSVPHNINQHLEDDYVDFYFEGLLTRKLSREGPALAIGDADGDGREDIFIGGAGGQPGAVYIQSDTGFVKTAQTALDGDADFEDTAAEWLDVDGDGDQDLYVGSGGNHVAARSRVLQDRLYINNGSGTLTLSPDALPVNGMNTSVVLGIDFDEDGDQDIISLSRSIPFNYGTHPRSYLFENDGRGVFSDATKDKSPDLAYAGMITDAILVDITGDGKPEMVIVGEWIPPKIFTFSKTGVTRITTDLESWPGWWGAVSHSDFDGDGLNDLVLGNIGENFYLHASPDEPLKLWLSDFDENGDVENIITRHVNGRDVPVALKRELTEQVVSLKKQSLKHSDFSTKSIQDLFPAEVLSKAAMSKIMTTASLIAWNEGNGKFRVEQLPVEVQLSCIWGIDCLDINNDNASDILLAGNDFGFAPQFGRLDAGDGHALITSENRQFDPTNCGFQVRGQARQIKQISIDNRIHVLVAVNNEAPLLFEVVNQ